MFFLVLASFGGMPEGAIPEDSGMTGNASAASTRKKTAESFDGAIPERLASRCRQIQVGVRVWRSLPR
jgi:hypothetical protein